MADTALDLVEGANGHSALPGVACAGSMGAEPFAQEGVEPSSDWSFSALRTVSRDSLSGATRRSPCACSRS